MSPRVLLLDEPTRGIDVGAKAEVQALIDELAHEGLAIMLVSSEVEEVVEGAARVIVLRDGSVEAELAGDEVDEEHLLAALAGDSSADTDASIRTATPDIPSGDPSGEDR
jgi:galactofuranose transport system ATP-binding protein